MNVVNGTFKCSQVPLAKVVLELPMTNLRKSVLSPASGVSLGAIMNASE